MELKFFYCKHCGKIIAIVKETETPTICCGEAMEVLLPATTDGAGEKHIPIIHVEGNLVTVTVGRTVAADFVSVEESPDSAGRRSR